MVIFFLITDVSDDDVTVLFLLLLNYVAELTLVFKVFFVIEDFIKAVTQKFPGIFGNQVCDVLLQPRLLLA